MKRMLVAGLSGLAALTLVACGSSNKTTSSTAAGNTTTTAASVTVTTGNPTSAVTLNEDGSSLLYPYLQELVTPLHTQFANVTLAPAAGGSGKGISDAIAGNVQMGGSDAYLSNSQISANPGLQNIPIAVSAQAVNYNLTGVSSLKLNGSVLAQMYEGKITKWNDPAVAMLNPGVTLPATPVVPVRRVDSSGDTFIFTSFLSATDTTWSNGPSFGTTVTWPAVSNELTASGNPGMVQTCQMTAGCVAYIGVSAEASAQSAHLGESMLQNKAGNYELPTMDTITAAVTAGSSSIPSNLAVSLIYQDGSSSYPIVNFEYIVVKSMQPNNDTALAIRDFLAWTMSSSGGSTSSLLAPEDFVALPTSVLSKVNAAIAMIQ